jgi:predicted DNA-binding protein (MmcQ/YjbR family)
VPPYVGRYGWIGVRLDRSVDWLEVAGLIEDSYGLTAPRRLVRSI